MPDNLELLKSRNVLEMLTVAHDFCIFTEEVHKKNKQQIYQYYQKVLPLLYVKGSLLPDIEIGDESANERFVTEEHWQTIYQNLEEKLGKEDLFWILDPVQDAQKASIADHIADIYQDIKDYVILFQNPRNIAKENAVKECKLLFESHWGQRVSRLIHAFHQLLYNDKLAHEEGVVL